MAARFPDHDAAALAFACRNLLPLIQVPPRGLWSRGGQVVGTTAPVRLLSQYDNLLLSHKDRSRFIPAGFEVMSEIWMEQRGFVGSVLVDGMLAGLWRIDESEPLTKSTRRVMTMTVTTPNAVADEVAAAIAAEGEQFLRFVDAHADHDVEFRVVG